MEVDLRVYHLLGVVRIPSDVKSAHDVHVDVHCAVAVLVAPAPKVRLHVPMRLVVVPAD